MKIIFASDWAAIRHFAPQIASNSVGVYGNLLSVLQQADYKIVNLETPLFEGNFITKSGAVFTSSPSSINSLLAVPFNCAILANNHTFDCGEEGFFATVDLLKNNNIATVGAGRNLDEAFSPAIIKDETQKIAIFALSEAEDMRHATENTPGVAPWNIELLAKKIKEAKGQNYFIIVSAQRQNEVYFVTGINGEKLELRYLESACFGDNIWRHIRKAGYINGVDNLSVVLDPTGRPFVTASLYRRTIGFAGEKVTGMLTVDMQNGEVKEYKLNKLPSQREAFTEFVRLAAKTTTVVDTVNGVNLMGYGVTPTPSSIGSDAGKTQAFVQGEIGMLVDGRWDVTYFRDPQSGINFTWDVCPLPMYREYDADGFGAERNVTVHGIEAGHSGSVGLCINKNSKLAAAAWKFIEFVASEEGQSAQAAKGFAIPLQQELANTEVFLQSDAMPRNSEVFIRAAEIQGAGDWWYLTDNAWIDDWAGVLNGDVRNGKKTMTEFFNSDAFNSTFDKLLKYTEKK